MPAVTLPYVPRWTPAPQTNKMLPWAELDIIDLAKAKTPEGRQEMVTKSRDAMHKQGFFYVINHGLEKPQTDRMFDIAAVPFRDVPPEEMKTYEADIKGTGEYIGYKPQQYWHIANGVRDRIDHYNFLPNVSSKQHPRALRPLLPEIQDFVRHNHETVIHELERLLALGLELSEDTLTKLTSYDSRNRSFFRFMMYSPRPEEEEIQSNNLWLKGHVDSNLLSVLWSQPVSGLNIRGHEDGEWRWVKRVDNALVVNGGDALSMLSGGYYKSAIHRVVQPPLDQRGYQRLGVFYFCSVNEDIPLSPLSESPLLQRVGVTDHRSEGQNLLMGTWRKARAAAYGTTELKKSEVEAGIEEEIVNGIRVKHYAT